jgi:hypothetical protein
MKRFDWCKIVCAAVPAAWGGHFYGYYRYMHELGVYSQQHVMRYTNELYNGYVRVYESSRLDYSIIAGLAMFFSLWILLVVGARIARRARG